VSDNFFLVIKDDKYVHRLSTQSSLINSGAFSY